MKHAANLISASRIFLALALFFSFRHTHLFFLLYVGCGLTDMLDGFVARKTGTQSELGARLDSIADIIFFTAAAAGIFSWMEKEILVFLPWIIATAILRGANMIIAAYKFRTFAILHTWGNKLTGFLLFITPLSVLYQQRVFLWIVCAAAIISSAEECLIHMTSPSLHLDRRSLFQRRR
ncbi:MAG: CDP-alcohol phosphatidyltransferase [Paenibacillaceae bacterium]|nr:CDP-alcohol phosphatidyltransferase [Paenibacillaceae bacterium]